MRPDALVLGVLGVLVVSGCPDRPRGGSSAGASAVRPTRPAVAAPRDAGPPPAAIDRTVGFARRFTEAFLARDAVAAGALFAPEAVFTLVGGREDVRGRPAIEGALRRVFDRYAETRLTVGRVWVSPAASVVEFVIGGTRPAGKLMGVAAPARRLGLVGAAVVVFQDDGLVRTQRLYLDVVTGMGQIAPRLLPPGTRFRPIATAAPDGQAVVASTGTAVEARNLAVTDAIWAAVDAHRMDAAMAPCADDYVYEDYAGPAALNKDETQRMVTRFLEAVPDFRISERPVRFAAGDDVISENVESATFQGKPIVLHALGVKRFREGKVVKEWQYANQVEVLTQAFGMKPPAEAPARLR
jgi:hypothetical protein